MFKAESGALVISSASSNVGDYFQTNRVVLSEKWLETPLKLNSEQLFLVNYYADHTPYELSSIYWGANDNWNREIFDKDFVKVETRKYNYSQLLIDEIRFNTDLSGDGIINGDTVEEIFSTSINSPYNNVAGLYKTTSGGLVFDSNSLQVGDNLMSPTSSLTKDGKLHNFKTTPSVAMQTDPNGNGHKEYSVFLKMALNGLKKFSIVQES